MGPEYTEQHVLKAKEWSDQAVDRVERKPDSENEVKQFLSEYLTDGSEESIKDFELDPELLETIKDREKRKDLTALREFQQGGFAEFMKNRAALEELMRGIDPKDRQKITEEIKKNQKTISAIVGLSRVIKFFGKSSFVERLKNAKNLLRDKASDARIEELSATSLEFLKALAEAQLTIPDIARLAPFLLRVLKVPEYVKIRDPNVFRRLRIRNPLPGRTVSTDMGKFEVNATINIPKDTFEYDMLMLGALDPMLLDTVWAAFAKAQGYPEEAEARKKKNNEAIRVYDMKKDILSGVKRLQDVQRLGYVPDREIMAEYIALSDEELKEIDRIRNKQRNPTRADDLLTPEEIAKLNQLDDRTPVSRQEFKELSTIVAKKRKGEQLTDRERMLEALHMTEKLTPEQRQRANELAYKIQTGTATDEEMREYEGLQRRLMKELLQGTQASQEDFKELPREEKIKQIMDDLRRRYPAMDDKRLRARAEDIYEGWEEDDQEDDPSDPLSWQNPSQRRLLKAFARSLDRDLLQALPKETDNPGILEERRFIELAIEFVKSCHSTEAYLRRFYSKVYQIAQQEIDAEALAKGETLDENERTRRVAIRTHDLIQRVLQTIVTSAYGPAIESGGEPTGDIAQAISKTRPQTAYNVTQLIASLSQSLVNLKVSAAKIRKLPELKDKDGKLIPFNLAFADPYRPMSDPFVAGRDKNRVMRVQTGLVETRIGNSEQDLQHHMQNIERFFDIFQIVVAGQYNLRAEINDGTGNFFKEKANGKLAGIVRSETFDITNNSEIGDEVAKAFVMSKALLMRYFSERGWIYGNEPESRAFEPEGYMYAELFNFMRKEYPDMSELRMRSICYAAMHQAYAHDIYPLMLSAAHAQRGFQGTKHKQINAYFDTMALIRKFPGSLGLAEVLTQRGFDKGLMHLPYAQFADAIARHEGGVYNRQDAKYGALMFEYSSRFGTFLRHLNERFGESLPDSMRPHNFYRAGSDDARRGWRQMQKSLGSVSNQLYQTDFDKDWIGLNEKFEKSDLGAYQLEFIWKSVENHGTNYVRSWMDAILEGIKVKNDKISHEPAVRQLLEYLYNRYFAGCNLGVNFGMQTLANLGYEDVASAQDLWNRLHAKMIQSKRPYDDVLKSVIYGALTIMTAERSPTVFLHMGTPWAEQTGQTLIAHVKTRLLAEGEKDAIGATFLDTSSGETTLRMDVWNSVVNNLVYIQGEARKKVTLQVKEKHREWESKDPNKIKTNIFGEDFKATRSSVRLSENSENTESGYVINDIVIEEMLKEKYAPLVKKGVMTQEDVDMAISQTKFLHKRVLTTLLERPDLPDYDEIKKLTLEGWNEMVKAQKEKYSEDESYIRKIEQNFGSSREEFEARYKNKLKTRLSWYMTNYMNSDFGFEPEVDAAENLSFYGGAADNHFNRMAGDNQDTVVETKLVVGNPDDEKSLNEMIKNFAKDPMATIDTMAEYLNQYRKKIQDAYGESHSIQFMNWYVNRVLQSNMSEERYRGISGIFNELMELLFGRGNFSMGGDRNRVFDGKPLSAADMRKVIRKMAEKKLIGFGQIKELQKKYRATLYDVFCEVSPRVALIILAAFIWQMVKESSKAVSGQKEK